MEILNIIISDHSMYRRGEKTTQSFFIKYIGLHHIVQEFASPMIKACHTSQLVSVHQLKTHIVAAISIKGCNIHWLIFYIENFHSIMTAISCQASVDSERHPSCWPNKIPFHWMNKILKKSVEAQVYQRLERWLLCSTHIKSATWTKLRECREEQP